MDELEKREKKWRLTQNLGFLFPTIMGLALLILVITFIIPNRPAAPDKVTQAMEKLGYSPWDTTEEFRQKWSMGDELTSCLSARTTGIRIDYVQTDNYSNRNRVSGQFSAYMNNVLPFPDDILHDGNHDYSLYCIGSNGHYLLKIEIRKAVLFIEWSSPQTPDVLEFLKEVDCPIPKKMKGWT